MKGISNQMHKVIRIAVPVVVGAAIVGVVSAFVIHPRQQSPACTASPVSVEKGLAIYWHERSATAATVGRARQIVAYAKSLGANSLSISFPIYVDGLQGNRVYAGAQTPDAGSLAAILDAARTAGLRTAVRPLIDEANLPLNEWRGTLRPTSPASWFQSYGSVIEPFAALAKSRCADEFNVAVELDSLQNRAAAWDGVAARVRATGFAGEISYAANWDRPLSFPFQAHPGLDFYPFLQLPQSATPEEVTGAMVHALKTMPAPFVKNVVIQETGFSAEGGHYTYPSSWKQGASTPGQQAIWVQAVCGAARRINARGLYFWGVGSDTDPFHPDPSSTGAFGFQGRPAEAAIRNCFSARW